MPYLSMLFYAKLNSQAFHRENLVVFFRNMEPASCLYSLIPLPIYTVITSSSDLPKPFQKSTPVPSAIVPLYSLDLTLVVAYCCAYFPIDFIISI